MLVFEGVALLCPDGALTRDRLKELSAKMRLEVRVCILALLVDFSEACMDVNDGRVRTPQDVRAVLARDVLLFPPCLVNANDLKFDAVDLPLLVEVLQMTRLRLLLPNRLSTGHHDVLASSTNRNPMLVAVLAPRSVANDAVFRLLRVRGIVEAGMEDARVAARGMHSQSRRFLLEDGDLAVWIKRGEPS